MNRLKNQINSLKDQMNIEKARWPSGPRRMVQADLIPTIKSSFHISNEAWVRIPLLSIYNFFFLLFSFILFP